MAMEPPTGANSRQQQVWPLKTHPPQLQLGQVQVLLPDAFVASMELQPAEALKWGFMCGSLPVPTFHPPNIDSSAGSDAALIPAISVPCDRTPAPRYRVLPIDTDLNRAPPSSLHEEPIFPVTGPYDAAGSCKAWAGCYLTQPLARKCEALAVNALTGYGDEIDVVAPADLLKQLFKTPYSKARLSLAVHRVGRTLIFNSGPDQWKEDRAGVKLEKNRYAQKMEKSLFSKFVQHSMNGQPCNSPPTPNSDPKPSQNNVSFEEFDDHDNRQTSSGMANPLGSKHGASLGHYRQNRRGEQFDTVQKRMYGREKKGENDFVQDKCQGDGQQRSPTDGYLRILFWQFQNLRMLLGSDLLLFSNEDHSAVSLRLLEIERQITPLVWLDAWLDNVMASIPELAVCYHRSGVVQGYELLKTDDIFLVKGLREDGTAFFHPHVVQKNASTVLRFLQDNCTQDPGTYWLLKNAGEDLLQLFDLSIISKTCAPHSGKDEKRGCGLPSGRSGCHEQYSLPLAMLLYRLTYRLSKSQDPADKCKSAKLFEKCLEFMEEQEHLITRASAHEHVARLILSSFKGIGSILAPLLLESSMSEGNAVDKTKEAVLKLPFSGNLSGDEPPILAAPEIPTSHEQQLSSACTPVSPDLFTNLKAIDVDLRHEAAEPGPGLSPREALVPPCQVPSVNGRRQFTLKLGPSTRERFASCRDQNSGGHYLEAFPHVDVEETPNSNLEPNNSIGLLSATSASPNSLFVLSDPVSARLAAVHHISQAIKSLRWQRQLDVGDDGLGSNGSLPKQAIHSHGQHLPLCICGEIECIAICDFRQIAIGAQMDHKLRRLMLLLGEAYFALGQAYKDVDQLGRALKAVELACLVCGSIGQSRDSTAADSQAVEDSCISWGTSNAPSHRPYYEPGGECYKSSHNQSQSKNRERSTTVSPKISGRQQGLFWGQVWTFVGDIFVGIHRSVGAGVVTSHDHKSHFEELTMAQEVSKEVKRLKKKIGRLSSNCGMCSLISCSCHSDRASSGDSASSCNSLSVNSPKFRRKNRRRSNTKEHAVNEAFCENDGKADTTFSDCISPLEYGEFAKGLKDRGCEGTTSSLLAGGAKDERCLNRGHVDPNNILSFVTRPGTTDWESNLSAAVECYSSALMTMEGLGECEKEIEGTQRKKGWACNELGRRRLADGQIKSAEAAFITAIEAFRVVQDPVNVVLVHCNLGHGQRAAAERLAAKLSSWDDCKFLGLFVQTIAEAKVLYGEALKFYGMARQELLRSQNEVRPGVDGLWTEVHTQLAHTYLRLGMLLAQEDKFLYACGRSAGEERFRETDRSGKNFNRIKDVAPTKDAITKAVEIYKTMGSLRAQEAAFAQYQLACHHRDACQKFDASRFHKAKLHASLAELYWQKALDFYRPETHPEMFLEILMERSALCLLMATSCHQHQMMEQSLDLLFEGRRTLVFGPLEFSNEGTDGWHVEPARKMPSAQVLGKLAQQVQSLLKSLLATALSLSVGTAETASRNDASGLPRASDVVKLKKMYRIALQSKEAPNLGLLHSIWTA